MLISRNLFAALFTVLALIVSGSALAGSGEGKTFFYNITTDEVWPAGMATAQAYNAAKIGHDVVVYLNVRGVYLASKDRKQDTLGATGRTAQETLKMAMDHGARVLVCPMCLDQAGLTPEDLIKGVEFGGAEALFTLLSRDGLVPLSY
ncbi:MAG: DsrE family protein [Halothiobacillaceae bacterium]